MYFATRYLVASAGPYPTIEELAEAVAALTPLTLFGAACSTFAIPLGASIAIMLIAYVGRWPADHFLLPILFWAFATSLLHLQFFDELPHPVFLVQLFLESLFALAIVVTLVSGGILVRRPDVPFPRTGAIWAAAMATVGVLLDFGFMIVVFLPYLSGPG
jgi:hypothetical protein